MIKEFSSLVLNCFMYGIKVAFKVLQVVQARSHVDTIENWSKLIQKYIETHFRIWDAVFMGGIMDNQLWRRKASYVFWKYSSVGYSFQRNFHYWASSIDWITPRIKNWGYNVNGTIKVYNIYFRINEKALNISIIMIIRRWKIVNFIKLHKFSPDFIPGSATGSSKSEPYLGFSIGGRWNLFQNVRMNRLTLMNLWTCFYGW